MAWTVEYALTVINSITWNRSTEPPTPSIPGLTAHQTARRVALAAIYLAQQVTR